MRAYINNLHFQHRMNVERFIKIISLVLVSRPFKFITITGVLQATSGGHKYLVVYCSEFLFHYSQIKKWDFLFSLWYSTHFGAIFNCFVPNHRGILFWNLCPTIVLSDDHGQLLMFTITVNLLKCISKFGSVSILAEWYKYWQTYEGHTESNVSDSFRQQIQSTQ